MPARASAVSNSSSVHEGQRLVYWAFHVLVMMPQAPFQAGKGGRGSRGVAVLQKLVFSSILHTRLWMNVEVSRLGGGGGGGGGMFLLQTRIVDVLWDAGEYD